MSVCAYAPEHAVAIDCHKIPMKNVFAIISSFPSKVYLNLSVHYELNSLRRLIPACAMSNEMNDVAQLNGVRTRDCVCLCCVESELNKFDS